MGTDAAFAALGIAAGSSSTEITRAFRVLCRVTHPDHGGDRQRFEMVLDAYRTLQSVGLVVRSREEPTTAVAARASQSPADVHYRRFLAGLDVAATFVPRPARQRRMAATASAASFPRNGVDFATLLERELQRSAA